MQWHRELIIILNVLKLFLLCEVTFKVYLFLLILIELYSKEGKCFYLRLEKKQERMTEGIMLGIIYLILAMLLGYEVISLSY